MKIVRGSWSTVVRRVVAGVVATLVATAAWGVSASATPVAETLTTTMTSTSSLDAMAVGDLGAVTNVLEPYHDVVAAEIASNATGQRTLGFVERTESGFDIKVATSATLTGSWSTFETIAQIADGSNEPDIEVSLGNNQVSTVIWTNANRDSISGSWRSTSIPEWETPVTLSTGLTSIAYLDVGTLAASAFITFRGYDTVAGSNRAFAIDWYQTVATAPTVVEVSSTSTKQATEVLQVTDGDDDAMVVWLQDPTASTTDTVWGKVWDGLTWYTTEQLSTSTGSTALSTLAIGHALNRMIVGWWEANTAIIIDYFDPSADTWNTGTITLQSGLNSTGVTKDLMILADPTQPNGIVAWTEKDGATNRHRGLISGSSGPGSPFWISNATDTVFNSTGGMRDNGMVGAMELDGDATVMWRYSGGFETTVIRFSADTGTWGAEATYGGTDGYKVNGHGTFGVTGGATSQTMWVLAGQSSVKALGTSTWSGTSPTTPSLLTDASTLDSGENLVLGVTPTGNSLAVWTDAVGEQLLYSTKSASASLWSAPSAIVDTYWIRNPRLVDDGTGNFALLWRERTSSVSSVVARVASWNQSSGWSTPTTISSATISIDCLTPAMTSAGSGLVTYVDSADQTSLYGATFDTEGNVTTGTVIATDSSGGFTCGGDANRFSIALANDGRYMIAFDASYSFGPEVYTVSGSLGSGAVASPTLRSPASTSSREYYYPKLASKPDGTVALVWNEYDTTTSTDSQTVIIGQIGSSFGAPINFDASTGIAIVDQMDMAYLADGSLVFTALQDGTQYDVMSMRLASGSATPSVALLALNVDQYYFAAHDSSSYNVLVLDYSDGSIDYHRLASGSTAWTRADVATPTSTLVNKFAVAVAGQADAIGWILDNSSTTWPQVAVRSVATPGLITLSPTRIINTRPTGKIGNRTGTADPMIFNVYGKGGLPMSGIGAVLLNVTVVDPEVGNEGGYLTVYPCASGRPDASNLNFVARQIIPNTVIAPVDPSGNICFHSYGQTHVLADVSGYFPTGSSLQTLTPTRIINTRPTGKIGNRTGTADPMIFNVYGKGGLPMSGIGAVLLNVTVVDPEVGNEGGFLTVYPCASGRPDASNLNFVARQIIPNTVIAPVDPSGNICFHSYGQTHVLADVSGYFPTS